MEGKESETSDKESNLPYVNGDENTEIVEMQGTENNEQFNNTDIIQEEEREGKEDFQIEDGILKAYLGNDKKIKIPDGVVEIGEGVFQNNTLIIEVILSDSIENIGNNAFSGCTGLKGRFIIPDSVLIIGNQVRVNFG